MANTINDAIFRKCKFVAVQLRTIAVDFAPVHLRAAISASAENVSEGVVLIRLVANRAMSPAGPWTNYKYGTSDARAQEYGSGPNARNPKGEIDIVPKEKPYLVFMGTNEFEGQIIKTQYVSSPGIPPYQGRGYLRPAVEELKRVIIPMLDPDIRAAIDFEIKLSFGQKPK